MFLNLYTRTAVVKFPSVRYTIKLIFTIVSSLFCVNCRPAESELSIQTRYKPFLSIKTFPLRFEFHNDITIIQYNNIIHTSKVHIIRDPMMLSISVCFNLK